MMKNLATRTAFAVATLAAMLGGCAANTDRYPSLAIRDFERVQGTFEVAAEEKAFAPPAPASESEIMAASDTMAAARVTHKSFVDLVPMVELQLGAARGLSPNDYEWTEGQLALAELDTLRSQVAILLGNLDLMFVDASLSYQELAEIEEARSIVRQIVEEEDAILGELKSDTSRQTD